MQIIKPLIDAKSWILRQFLPVNRDLPLMSFKTVLTEPYSNIYTLHFGNFRFWDKFMASKNVTQIAKNKLSVLEKYEALIRLG